MSAYYPLVWALLGAGIYHMIGKYGVARKRLFEGGEIDLTKLSRLK